MEKEKKIPLSKLDKYIQELMPRNPKEAAKFAVVPHIMRESWYALYTAKDFATKTRDYSAHIKNKKIVITEYYEIPVHEEYELEEILTDVGADFLQILSKPQ